MGAFGDQFVAVVIPNIDGHLYFSLCCEYAV